MDNPQLWMEVIGQGGTIGVLVLICILFYTGKIMPRSIVNRILKESEASQERLAVSIKAGIAQAVRDGIVAARASISDGKKKGNIPLTNPRKTKTHVLKYRKNVLQYL
jgi:hypothetical protein